LASALEQALISLFLLDQASALDKMPILERILPDSALGSEVRLSPIILSLIDTALGSEYFVSILAEVLTSDSSIAYGIVSEKSMIRYDLASAFEQALINLSRIDQASFLEKIIYREFTIQDFSSGLEVRLSPIPLHRYDIASALEKTLQKDMQQKDIASVLEQALIGLSRVDQASTLDKTSILGRILADSALGSEVRLSPVPLASLDFGVGFDLGWLSYKEMFVSDIVSSLDKLASKEHIQPDIATTLEQALIGLSRVDLASAIDRIIHAGILVFDSATASDIRISPVPLFRSDVGVFLDKIARKDMRYLRDIASTIEQALISLNLLDQASTLDRSLIEKLVEDIASAFEVRLSPMLRTVFDVASGIETRLSPIPLARSDLALAIDKILERIFELPEYASGTDITKVKSMTGYDLSSGLEK